MQNPRNEGVRERCVVQSPSGKQWLLSTDSVEREERLSRNI